MGYTSYSTIAPVILFRIEIGTIYSEDYDFWSTFELFYPPILQPPEVDTYSEVHSDDSEPVVQPLTNWQKARLAILADNADYELQNSLEWLPFEAIQEAYNVLYFEAKVLIKLFDTPYPDGIGNEIFPPTSIVPFSILDSPIPSIPIPSLL